MIPTPIGLLFLLVGLIMLRRPPVQMLVFACACTLFPAASAIDLPALGHSSIPPATMSLGFVALRLSGRDVSQSNGPALGLEKNSWLIIFCLYCAITAFILPRIFSGKIDVIPLGKAGTLYFPLTLTPQNITQAVYMLGTAFAAVGGTILATRMTSVIVLVRAFVVLTWVHSGTGIADVVLSLLHVHGAFDFVRNGAYAQLDQGVGVFHRISGMCPEPSVYAALGTVFFVFMCELWLRRIIPRRTGPAAMIMLLLLVLCTSSTGYAALSVYVVVLLARALLIPGAMALDRLVVIFAVTMVGVAAGLTVILLSPNVAASFSSTLADMTVNKAQSASGFERGLWARQGWDVMKSSHGLGIGVGSFRSSSLITAILGSVGPAGMAVFVGYLFQVGKFGMARTYVSTVDERTGAGAAAGWAALLALVPAAISFTAADPGILFALMAGLSLGWRAGVIAPPSSRESRSIPGAAILRSNQSTA